MNKLSRSLIFLLISTVVGVGVFGILSIVRNQWSPSFVENSGQSKSFDVKLNICLGIPSGFSSKERVKIRIVFQVNGVRKNRYVCTNDSRYLVVGEVAEFYLKPDQSIIVTVCSEFEGIRNLETDYIVTRESAQSLFIVCQENDKPYFFGRINATDSSGLTINGVVKFYEESVSIPSDGLQLKTPIASSQIDLDGYFSARLRRDFNMCGLIEVEGFSPTIVICDDQHISKEEALEIDLTLCASLQVRIEPHDSALTYDHIIEITATPDTRGSSELELALVDDLKWTSRFDIKGNCQFSGLPARVELCLRGIHRVTGQVVLEKKLRLHPAEKRVVTIP